MSSSPMNEIIPEGYRRQSEIEHWLPGVNAVQSAHGVSAITAMCKKSKRRQSRILMNLYIGTILISLGAYLFITIPAGSETRTVLTTILIVALPVFIMFLGFWLISRFLHKGLWGKGEPYLRDALMGEQQDEAIKLCEYWDSFLKSNYQIIASTGNNGLGVSLDYKMKEYGFLALIGNTKQRGAIFTPIIRRIDREWWFPGPEMLKDEIKSSPRMDKTEAPKPLDFRETDRVHFKNKKIVEARKNEIQQILSKLNEVGVVFHKYQESKGLQYLLENNYIEIYDAIKQACLDSAKDISFERCEKGFYVLEDSYKSGKKSIRQDIDPKYSWNSGITKSVYKSICSGNYDSFNTRLRWLVK